MSKIWNNKNLKVAILTPYRGVIAFFVLLIAISVGVRVHCSTNLAVKNNELKELAHRKEKLQKDILSLTYDTAASSSLAMVEERARTLGFIELTEPIYAIDQGISPQVASLR